MTLSPTRSRLSLIACFGGACLFAHAAGAATLYVKPTASGSGNGSDWSNALGANFTPVRGNTYYIADGSYPQKYWNTANSGTTSITIKKATVADHGTNTGWSNTLGDGQAIWSKWEVHTDYWVFDGQVRNSNWADGATSQYGFKVTGGGRSGKTIRMDNGGGVGCDYSTFRYIDIVGGGQNTGNGDDGVYGLTSNTNITFQYCAVRDTDRTLFLWRGDRDWQNFTAEYCYLARNNSTPAIHGELVSCVGADNAVWRYNVIEDIEGTAIWAVLNGGGSKSAANTASGWKIYGNLIRSTATGETYSGYIFVANDSSNRNWMDNLTYVNNTHVNTKNSYYTIFMNVAGTGNVASNNIFYSCRAGTWSNGGTTSYNWYFNTPNNSDNGTGKVSLTSGGADYFASVPSNMRLTKAIPGNALAADLKVDFDGKTRGADGTWDRGAFEFGGSVADTTAPTIGTVQASGASASEVTISWTTNESATSAVEYGLTTSYGTTSSDATRTTSHSRKLTGLQAGKTYQYRVKSVDASGNVATSGNYTFTTAAAADTAAPVISNVQSSRLTTSGATINWTTNEAATTVVEYGTTTAYGTTATDATLTTGHTATLSGLQSGKTYQYRVKSVDAAGNVATSGNYTFTTPVASDVVAPAISGVQVSGVTASGATVAWTTNEPATSVVEYGTTTAYGETANDVTPTTSHKAALTGLKAATTYHYRVKSADAAGNVSTSGNFSFVTSSSADTIAPQVTLTSPASGATLQGNVTLTANATDNVRVAGVEFLVDGKVVAPEDTTAPYSVTWNSASVANGGHLLQVRARDAAGNMTTSTGIAIKVSNAGLKAGLVGYWKFNEGSGTKARDVSGNGGVATLQPGATWARGFQRKGLQLNGNINVYASVPDSPALRISNTVSLSMWVKLTTLPAANGLMYLLEKGVNDHDNYAIGVYTGTQGTRLFFEFEDMATRSYRQIRQVSGGTLQAGKWTLVTVVFDGNADQVRFHLQGQQVASMPEGGSMNPALTGPLHIGRENMAGYEWPTNGIIDEVRIYNRAFTTAEVAALYQSYF